MDDSISGTPLQDLLFSKSAAGYALCKFLLIAERAGANWVYSSSVSFGSANSTHMRVNTSERVCLSLNVLLAVRLSSSVKDNKEQARVEGAFTTHRFGAVSTKSGGLFGWFVFRLAWALV